MFHSVALVLSAALASPSPVSAKTHSQSTPGQYVSDGYRITWSASDLRAVPIKAPDRVIFSAKQVAKSYFARQLEDHSRCQQTREFRLLSLVGSIMSYADTTSGNSQDQHPLGETDYIAINLRKGGMLAKLTDIFLPEDLYKALMGDKVIQKALEKTGAEPTDLAQLQDAFGSGLSVAIADPQKGEPLCFTINSEFLNRFAFHHIDSDKVWVRIGLPGNEDCRGELTEIGITLPLPQSLQDELAAADQGNEGILMKDTDRRAKVIHTVFSCDSTTDRKRTAHATTK
ncbi:MAG TPA: hypothetical protein V6C69_07155 [Trichormus sp.]